MASSSVDKIETSIDSGGVAFFFGAARNKDKHVDMEHKETL